MDKIHPVEWKVDKIRELEAELLGLKATLQYYHDLAAADGCPYDKGECDARAVLKSHITKTIALLDDMRYTDKYNSRVQFDVYAWDKELRETYPELSRRTKP